MIKVYFESIHLELIQLLKEAKKDVKICVAWFTDKEIYNVLVEKACEGVFVDVIIANHQINKNYGFDFSELLQKGARVSYIGQLDDGINDSLMHNKFCVIDSDTVISGSYNWSYKARKNDENILVIRGDSELSNNFLDKFASIQPKYGFKLGSKGVEVVAIQEIMNKWKKGKGLKNNNRESPKSDVVQVGVNKITDKF